METFSAPALKMFLMDLPTIPRFGALAVEFGGLRIRVLLHGWPMVLLCRCGTVQPWSPQLSQAFHAGLSGRGGLILAGDGVEID